MTQAGGVYVEYEARMGKLDGQMRQVERKFGDSAKRLDKISKQIDPMAGLAKAVFHAEKLKGAVAGVSIPLLLLKGDMAALDQTVRRLPFGFGELAGMTMDAYRALSGSAAAAERMRKSVAAAAEHRAFLQKLIDAAEVAGLEGPARQRAIIRQQTRDAARDRLSKSPTEAPEATFLERLELISAGIERTIFGDISTARNAERRVQERIRQRGGDLGTGRLKRQIDALGADQTRRLGDVAKGGSAGEVGPAMLKALQSIDGKLGAGVPVSAGR